MLRLTRDRKRLLAVLLLSVALAASACSKGPATTDPEDVALSNMVLIPGGLFGLGCVPGDELCLDSEQPWREVGLDPFYLDEREVSAGQYDECVQALACDPPQPDQDAAEAATWGNAKRVDHPVNFVSWFQADRYCRWRGKRLPRETEFEAALRAGRSGQRWPWGDQAQPPRKSGNYADASFAAACPACPAFPDLDDGFAMTAPVGSFKRNKLGLYDMSGNVREWCADPVDIDIEADGLHLGAFDELRAARGGSMTQAPQRLRCSARDKLPAFSTSLDLGFRCARDY